MAGLARDFTAIALSSANRAMLLYAAKLTRQPAAMNRVDVEALRSAGFDDRAVLDIAQVTAYFNFVNRLAQGLGVELETSWQLPFPPPE